MNEQILQLFKIIRTSIYDLKNHVEDRDKLSEKLSDLNARFSKIELLLIEEEENE